MFGIDFSEILVIFAVALVVLGPQRLPKVAAQVGRWLGRARAMARQFREQLEEEDNFEETRKASAAKTPPKSEPPPATPPPAAATSGAAASGSGDASAATTQEPSAGEATVQPHQDLTNE